MGRDIFGAIHPAALFSYLPSQRISNSPFQRDTVLQGSSASCMCYKAGMPMDLLRLIAFEVSPHLSIPLHWHLKSQLVQTTSFPKQVLKGPRH